MSVQKVVSVVCDFKGCGLDKEGPAMLSWNETLVEQGKVELPELAKYLVLITHNNVLKSFCCQLHAAEYFLPPGNEIKLKPVIELPKQGPEVQNTPVLPWQKPRPVVESETWMDEPQRSEAVSQPDGFGPEIGQEGA